MREELLRVDHISLKLGDVQILNNVNLNVFQGEVLGLIGENGAGKSSLIKLLSGLYHRNNGTVYFNESPVNFTTPLQALNHGIYSVFQNANLVPCLTVAENIFMGRLSSGEAPFWLKTRQIFSQAEACIKSTGFTLDPKSKVSDLTVSQKQILENVKALTSGARLILMDEPTSAMPVPEIELLMQNIERIRQTGTSIIFISHKLEEVIGISDRITIMRDGTVATTLRKEQFDRHTILAYMSGENYSRITGHANRTSDYQVLHIDRLSGSTFSDVSLQLRRGEILGIWGLEGSCAQDLTDTVFGLKKTKGGRILINGRQVRIRRPKDAIRHRVAYLKQDTLKNGIFLNFNAAENTGVCALEKVNKLGFINQDMAHYLFDHFKKKIGINVLSNHTPAKHISGGNQQKLIVARWLAISPQILIMDEMTNGMDVKSRSDIHNLVNEMVKEGFSFIIISKDIREILELSDHVIVMGENGVKAEFDSSEITKEMLIEFKIKE